VDSDSEPEDSGLDLDLVDSMTWLCEALVSGTRLNVHMLQADGEDELKKMQLMELAIMNGTYREALPQPGATFVINTPRMMCYFLCLCQQ